MTAAYCINGHLMGPGERFCGTCGAPAMAGQPAPGTAPQPQPGGTSPIIWVVAALIVVAAGIVIALLLMDDGGGGGTTVAGSSLPPVSQPTVVPSSSISTSSSSTTSSPTSSTTSTTTSTTTTTTTIPGPSSILGSSWQIVTGGDLAGSGGQDVHDIVSTADGYVAIGLDGFSAIWTSPDALTWTRVPQGPEWNGTQLLHLEKGPDGTLVAAGRVLGPPHLFAAWTSPDGRTWTQQPPAAGTLPGGVQQVHDFEAYPGGFVAVGSVQDGAGEVDAAWWISPDAVTWTAHTISEPGLQQMIGVAVHGDTMVAAGSHDSDTGIWRAGPAQPFARVDDINLTIQVSDRDPTYASARVFAWDVAATGPGFVAVGADQTTAGNSAAAVWTSTDGTQWLRFGNETEAVPHMANANFAGNGPWTVMDTVLDSNGTAIAIGRTGTTADPDLAVWESADGFTWNQGPVATRATPQRAHRALAIDGKVIAVGGDGAVDGTGDAAVWVLSDAGGGATQTPGCAMDWTVQSGSIQSGGAGVVSAVINPVDRSKSFLVFSTRYDLARPVSSVRGRLAPDGASVEFERVTDETSAVDIAWQVVTYPCGVVVQHGETLAGPATVDVSLNPITATDQAFVLLSKTVDPTDGSWSDDDPTVAEITSTTNLQFRHAGIVTGHIISWQVVEFTDPAAISVQRGSTSIIGAGLAATVTLPRPVDTSVAFPLVSFRINDGALADVGAHLITARLTGPQTLVVERSTAGSNDIIEVLWEVVELKDGSNVRHGSASLAGGVATDTETISPFVVDQGYAFATVQGSNGQSLGQTPYALDDNAGVSSFTLELAAPDRLILTRSATVAGADVGWVVVTRN